MPLLDSSRQEYRSHAVEGTVSLSEHFAGSSGNFVLIQDVLRNSSRERNQLYCLVQLAASNAVWNDGHCRPLAL
jgi:hypothetical protein